MSTDNEDKEAALALERGRWLFTQSCDFMLGVVKMAQLPDDNLPEVAFAGRSNVGKSSLINALTGRKTLARTSNTPGRTREVNFFDLAGKLHLVDLPGYGYARASKTEVAKWNQLIFDYLKGRPSLMRVCVLIDARHGIKPNDEPVFKTLDDAAVSYQVVLTKADKIRKDEQDKVLQQTRQALLKRPAAHPEIILTSSEKGYGIDELRASIARLAHWD